MPTSGKPIACTVYAVTRCLEIASRRLPDDLQARHRRSRVKTIGDAVMAVFSRPTDAVSAALHILEEIERFYREHGEPGIILKIGAHCGPSIAVTLNDNLDYFGQTVNFAAGAISGRCWRNLHLGSALYGAKGQSSHWP